MSLDGIFKVGQEKHVIVDKTIPRNLVEGICDAIANC
jgi:hypothetical protein